MTVKAEQVLSAMGQKSNGKDVFIHVFAEAEINSRDVTWAISRLRVPTSLLLIQNLIEAEDRDSFEARHYWPLVIERWPMHPLTKGQ